MTMTTTTEIEYPVVEESLYISTTRWMQSPFRGDVYRARALALTAQCRRLRTIAGAASNNERDALRLMLVTRGAMAIMEDCERHQMARLREWIASNRGKVLSSAGVDTLRAIFEIGEGG